MKNERDAGFSRKRGGNAGSGAPHPDPVCIDQIAKLSAIINITEYLQIEVKRYHQQLII